jgi:hypothetical protein
MFVRVVHHAWRRHRVFLTLARLPRLKVPPRRWLFFRRRRRPHGRQWLVTGEVAGRQLPRQLRRRVLVLK